MRQRFHVPLKHKTWTTSIVGDNVLLASSSILAAVIFKITYKKLLVDFFNNVKGSIPLKEAG